MDFDFLAERDWPSTVETIQGVQGVRALYCSEDNKGLFVSHELGYKETRLQTQKKVLLRKSFICE